MMRALRALGAMLALCFALALPAPAYAHASLVDTDPVPGAVLEQAPETVRLQFSESVAPARAVELVQPDGRALTVALRGGGKVVIAELPELPQRGTHVLSWRVVSSDGHTIRGSLPFSIGEPSAVVVSAAVDDDRAVLHTVLGVLLVVGALLAVGLAWSRTLLVHERARRRARRVLLAGAAVASAAVVARAVLVSREIDRVLASEVVAAVLVVLGAALLVAGAWRGWVEDGWAGARARAGAALLGGALVLGGLAAVGHSRAAEHPWLAGVATVLHAGAGAIWAGGVLALALGGGAALARFATRAWLALLVVTGAGVLLATTIYDSWSDLAETDHGRVLVLKVVLVAAAALLGLSQRLRLRRSDPAVSGTGGLRLEACLLVGVLVATGVLGEASPTRSDDAPLVVERAATHGDLEVRVRVAPARVGVNQVEVTVRDPRGAWVPLAAPATLTARHGESRVGGELHPVGETNLITTVLSDDGTWRLDLALPLSRYESPVLSVEVPIAP